MLAERAAAIGAGVYDAVYVGDLPTIARAGNRFDALLMGELIEHVPYAALKDFISSAARVLSPRGDGWSCHRISHTWSTSSPTRNSNCSMRFRRTRRALRSCRTSESRFF
jgi:2-polyprenyl-3-methyl-5-hydroxy-6-metoxy-1,4-benzoquinol methylase